MNKLPVLFLKNFVIFPNQEIKLELNNEISKKIINLANKNFNSQLETIGDYAFIYNDFTDVVIPSSVKTIGTYGLYTYNIKTVTMEGRTSLGGMTLGDSWAGAAKILYQ